MKIFNLTQHEYTEAQKEAGVVEPVYVVKNEIKKMLTFDTIPGDEEIRERAKKLAELAHDACAKQAMIGGAPFLMSSLENSLRAVGIKPVYAFTRRVVKEAEGKDGAKVKIAEFRHLGFVFPPQI